MNNKQNILSSKYLLSYYLSDFIKMLVHFMVVVILAFLIIFSYSKALDLNVKRLEKSIDSTVGNKIEYEKERDALTLLYNALDSTSQRLEYVQSLHGDVSDFDIFMNYIVNVKPYDVALISVEDITVIDAQGIQHYEPTPVVSEVETEDGFISTVVDIPQEEIPVETPIINKDASIGGNWNPNKFDNSLTYTRDIGQGYTLIRGYSANVASIANYVDSIAQAPEIQGYTIEGIEDKITHIEDTNIILFELKIKMKGVGA